MRVFTRQLQQSRAPHVVHASEAAVDDGVRWRDALLGGGQGGGNGLYL
jgi:hypothetical protein